MKRVVAGFAALVVVGTPAAVLAQGATEQKAERAADNIGDRAKSLTKDAWLVGRTKIALYADERVSGSAVNVDAKNGVVTLHGTVANAEAKNAAEAIAKGIEGVASVKNNLGVVANPGSQSSAGRSDDEIRKAVKDRIQQDALLKSSNVEVRADNGVVTLIGEVKDLDARVRASELARGIAGVKLVKNDLKEKS
jgi:hyperosmotically inducible protein